MGGGGGFGLLCFKSPSPPRLITSFLRASTHKQYYSAKGSKGREGGGHGAEGRAPSTAEEFKRVAEEKQEHKRAMEEEARGVRRSQTSDKAFDAAQQEALLHDPNIEAVKQKHKKAPPPHGDAPPSRNDEG